MGTNFNKAPPAYRTPSIRGEQGVGNRSGFIGRAAGGASAKNLAVANAMAHAMKLKSSTQTAASNARGPRKV